jgi:hypothetical protein
MVAQLADRCGSLRAFALALAGEGGPDLEPAVRRWLALGQGTLRPIGEINRIIAQLAKFSRAELRKMRRRIRTEPAPTGDRQIINGYLSLVYGARKPVVLAPEEMLALPAALTAVGFGPKGRDNRCGTLEEFQRCAKIVCLQGDAIENKNVSESVAAWPLHRG